MGAGFTKRNPTVPLSGKLSMYLVSHVYEIGKRLWWSGFKNLIAEQGVKGFETRSPKLDFRNWVSPASYCNMNEMLILSNLKSPK